LTTRCSSAFALIASCWVVVCAQSSSPAPFPAPSTRPAKVDRTPPPLFPVQPVWTLALNNLLVVPTAYDETHAFFSIEGDRLVAYDLMSGEQRWLVSARPLVQPATGDGLVFVVESETLIWRRDLTSPVHGRPALAADRVYAPTTDGRIVALRVETGEPLWTRRIGGMANDVLALAERVFVGSTDNFFYCLLAKDGVVDWRWRTGGDIIGAPIADDSRVYFVALDNVLRALSQKSGGQQWMRPLPIRPAWGPVAAGSTIVVAGLAPAVKGFSMKDGAPAGDVTAASEVAMAPYAFEERALHRPMLLVTTRDIAKGGSAALSERSFEPAVAPVGPLPNLVQIAPLTPAAPMTPRP
jgi:hypothetical protein